MKIPFVDLQKQYLSIKNEIDDAIKNIIENTAFIKGKTLETFEQSFASMFDVKHCIGVGNGTDALIIALKAIGIGREDEIIVPANSFIASSEAITAVGAKVVFVDNHPQTYNINVDLIEEKITNRTKAIIPVHLYGQISDMEAILDIAQKHQLKIIEDSAQAHLAEYQFSSGKWKMAGTMGDMATFSFFPGKNLGAYGDAGAIVTNNDDLARTARMYANHGRVAKYDHEFEGLNSRLDGLQAAILNVKLNYINEWTDKRRKAAAYYSELLKDMSDITIPKVEDKFLPAWHLYVIRTEKRYLLQSFLKEKGISTGIHYPIALPNLKAYQYLAHKPSDFPIASAYQHTLLSLPIFPEITNAQIEYVVKNISDFFKGTSKLISS
jgi:dTDP-4-amino-4,6-dideoxygalactose transaminase